MKNIFLYSVIAASIAFTLPASADPYWGIAHSRVQDTVESAIEFNAPKLFFGSKLSDEISIEAGISHLGSTSESMGYDGYSNVKFRFGHIIDISLLSEIPLNGITSVYSKIGLTNARLNASIGGYEGEYVTDTDMHVGLGLKAAPDFLEGVKLFVEGDILPSADLYMLNFGIQSSF